KPNMNSLFKSICPAATILFALVMIRSGESQEVDRGALTRKYLLRRQEYQRTHSQGLTAFHNFTFKDGFPQSQITFTNYVVDDAAKDWKPAHYDHGNGVAV